MAQKLAEETEREIKRRTRCRFNSVCLETVTDGVCEKGFLLCAHPGTLGGWQKRFSPSSTSLS